MKTKKPNKYWKKIKPNREFQAWHVATYGIESVDFYLPTKAYYKKLIQKLNGT